MATVTLTRATFTLTTTPIASVPADLTSCLICREDMSDAHVACSPVRLHGEHYFCHACISEWLGEHNTCPMCRLRLFALEQTPNASTEAAVEAEVADEEEGEESGFDAAREVSSTDSENVEWLQRFAAAQPNPNWHLDASSEASAQFHAFLHARAHLHDRSQLTSTIVYESHPRSSTAANNEQAHYSPQSFSVANRNPRVISAMQARFRARFVAGMALERKPVIVHPLATILLLETECTLYALHAECMDAAKFGRTLVQRVLAEEQWRPLVRGMRSGELPAGMGAWVVEFIREVIDDFARSS